MSNDYRRFVGRRVLLFADDDLTLDGTLAAAGGQALTLEHVRVLSEGGEARPVDGQAVVPLSRVAWVQVP